MADPIQVYCHGYEVIRDSDGHQLIIFEVVTTDDSLVTLSVVDPRDYDEG